MLNIKVFRVSIWITFVFLVLQVNAQKTAVISDLEMWNSFSISKKISKKWKVSLNEELRFTKDISRFDVFLTEVGVDYKLNKHFGAEVGYRFYQNKNSEDVFVSQHRLSVGVTYKQKIDRFTVGYKIQLQNKDEDEFLSAKLTDRAFSLRNKLSVDYNINHFKADPYMEVELFRRYESGVDAYFNKVRWTMGTSYPITKKSDIQLFYRIENELQATYGKDTYILGLGYKISF